MSPTRRRARSTRIVVATVVLAVSAIAASAALMSSSVAALTGATVLGVLAGVLAAGLMSAEIVVIRRLWAYDRAQMASRYREETKRRQVSHVAFVEHVSSRLAWRENQIGVLQDALLTSEIEVAIARERLSAEKARTEALQADVTSATTDLDSARSDLMAAQDALAASEAAGVAARAEIIAWQQMAESQHVPGHRRLA